MKIILSVILLALLGTLQAQDNDLMQDAITKPTLSLRCRELFKERDEKIRVQQRLNSLLKRNETLLKQTPSQKQSVISRLESSKIRVKNELYLANLQISGMEESIVRSGCPGLNL